MTVSQKEEEAQTKTTNVLQVLYISLLALFIVASIPVIILGVMKRSKAVKKMAKEAAKEKAAKEAAAAAIKMAA